MKHVWEGVTDPTRSRDRCLVRHGLIARAAAGAHRYRCVMRAVPALLLALGLTFTTSACTAGGEAGHPLTAQPPSTGEPPVLTDGRVRERHVSSEVVIRSDADVSDELVSTIAGTIAIAQRELGNAGSLVIQVRSNGEDYIQATAGPFGRSVDEGRQYLTVPTHVMEATLGSMWIFAPRMSELSPDRQRTILIHEYFHNMQFFLSRGRALGPAHHAGSSKDSARYAELTVGETLGYTSVLGVGDLESNMSTVIRHVKAGVPGTLSSYEDPGRDETYSTVWHDLGFLAADYLVRMHGVDKVSRGFWSELVRSDWRSAFAVTFGVTVDQFYADFQRYLDRLP